MRREVVSLHDIMPTVLRAAGLDVPETCDGMDMMPLVRGGQAAWRSYLHGEHVRSYSHEQANHYLTDGKTKYAYFPYLAQQRLFDLTTDPGETRDLAADPAHADTLALWRGRLIDELAARDSTDLLDRGDLRRLAPHETWTSPHYGVFGATPAPPSHAGCKEMPCTRSP